MHCQITPAKQLTLIMLAFMVGPLANRSMRKDSAQKAKV